VDARKSCDSSAAVKSLAMTVTYLSLLLSTLPSFFLFLRNLYLTSFKSLTNPIRTSTGTYEIACHVKR
jgi:hypothetical protein